VRALFPPGRVHAIQRAKLAVRIQDRIFSRLDDGSKVDLIDYQADHGEIGPNFNPEVGFPSAALGRAA
jgi:hypothetical protein